MNKLELIDVMSQKLESSKKDAERSVSAFVDIIKEELVKGNKVHLVGFGTFEIAQRAARLGRNPKTGDPVQIEASKSPKFKAAKALKDLVNGGDNA